MSVFTYDLGKESIGYCVSLPRDWTDSIATQSPGAADPTDCFLFEIPIRESMKADKDLIEEKHFGCRRLLQLVLPTLPLRIRPFPLVR